MTHARVLASTVAALLLGCGSASPPMTVLADVPTATDAVATEVSVVDSGLDAAASDAASDVASDAPDDRAPPPDRAPDVVTTGVACSGDGVCAAPTTCDRGPNLYTRGLCTRPCAEPRVSPAAQLTACGFAGSTCLATGFFGGRCVTACDPRTPTVCGRGKLCSSLWFDQPGTAPDEPGCVRFCADDSDCIGDPGGPRCRRRLGVCDRGLDDPTLLADGSPCNPTGVAQCRGFCLEAIDAQPSHGVCASLIDRTRGDACPDTPMSVIVRGPMAPDQIGMCAFQRCTRNCECVTGLVCIYEEGPDGRPITTAERTCRFATPTQRTGVPCP